MATTKENRDQNSQAHWPRQFHQGRGEKTAAVAFTRERERERLDPAGHKVSWPQCQCLTLDDIWPPLGACTYNIFHLGIMIAGDCGLPPPPTSLLGFTWALRQGRGNSRLLGAANSRVVRSDSFIASSPSDPLLLNKRGKVAGCWMFSVYIYERSQLC